MRAVVALLLVPLLSLAIACDSSESDVKSDGGTEGGGPRPVSTFLQEAPTARQIQGHVLLGTESVSSAIVEVVPSFGAWQVRVRDGADPFLTTTDFSGLYHVVNGPFIYDLSVRKDREVAVFQGLTRRDFDPSLGRDAEVRGFTARIAARTDPPPAPGNAVAFMIEGADARTLSGDPGSLLATFRRFGTTITLRAIEYVASGGLASAVRAGKIDVLVHDGGATSAIVPTNPESAATANDIRFIALPPAGFALSMVDVTMDFGLRTAARPVASVTAGTPLRIAIVADARYFARVRALHDGAISDSGRRYFNPFDKAVALTLPPPIAEAKFNRGDFSAATSKGVIEHVLMPAAADGISLRIASESGFITVPDLSRLGLGRPTGSYSWVVQHFAELPHVDDLGGDGRVNAPVSSSAPRTIDLR